MKKRNHKSLQCEIYDWLASMDCARIKKKCGIISFCNEAYEALAVFHENSLMELSIEDKKTGEMPFYLHFEARDPKTAKEHIQAFFDFFKDQHPAKEHLSAAAAKISQPMKLLVSCTSGLTSSYFAYTMKNALKKAGIDITIDAVSYTEIEHVQSHYDYILLAPQIAYKLPEYRKQYGNKVMTVDSRDFASYDVNRVINRLARLDGTSVA